MLTHIALLPPLFREALSEAGLPAVDEWWSQLDASARAEALQLWDECSQVGAPPALKVEARFVEDRSQEPNHDPYTGSFWHRDFYDYLVNHEIYLPRARAFHICTRHTQAAAAVRAGVIAHDFSCPFQSDDCPMHRLLAQAPGKSARLGVSVVRGSGRD